MRVIAALPAEIGIDFDHIADVGDQNERWIGVIIGERAGVILRLLLGGDHHLVPGPGPALGMAQLLRGGDTGQFQLLALARPLALGRLLGFEDEALALVAVDAPGGHRAAGMAEGDGSLEDIVAEHRVLTLEIGLRQAERGGQPLDEELGIRHFRPARRFCIGDELLQRCVVGVPHGPRDAMKLGPTQGAIARPLRRRIGWRGKRKLDPGSSPG
ncbi:hypothetical protein Q9K01_05265 [Qipengyuania sp. DY56-A-20]|uniref:Uncharacterized protein n=1 Tax=Qipengyuania benthica TaxID=3067651 RepID=A0ABT9H6U1_9SPHN|nr:hypothetical protein [Qipengyuania sp. DY56-A-20]